MKSRISSLYNHMISFRWVNLIKNFCVPCASDTNGPLHYPLLSGFWQNSMSLGQKIDARRFPYGLGIKNWNSSVSTDANQFMYFRDNSFIVGDVHSQKVVRTTWTDKAVLDIYYY